MVSARILAPIAFAILILLSTPAQAQKVGPNGGLLSGRGGHETELVVSPTEMTVFILHDGKPDNTAGTKIRAVVQQDGKSTTLNFADEGRKLVAKLSAPLQKGAIIVITGKDHHGSAISARHILKQ